MMEAGKGCVVWQRKGKTVIWIGICFRGHTDSGMERVKYRSTVCRKPLEALRIFVMTYLRLLTAQANFG